MEGIQQAGSVRGMSFQFPAACLPGLVRCLVQEKVEGPSAGDIFKTGDEQSRVAAARTMRSVVGPVSRRCAQGGPVSYAHEHLKSKSMQRCARKIAKLTGPFANKAARLLQRLEAASSSLSPVELRAGHGSYSASHEVHRWRRCALAWTYMRGAIAPMARAQFHRA